MAEENELAGTQPGPEDTSAENPGNSPAPEQNDDEHDPNAEAGNEGEGGEEQQPAERQEEPEKPKQKQPFYEKRFGELTFEKREAQRERDEARAELAALKAGKQPEPGEQEPVQRQQPANSDSEVERRAAQIVDQREYKARVDGVIAAGNKDFDVKTFTEKSNLVAGIAGDRAYDLLNLVTDPEIVKDGHKVIAALADQPEEAERILALPLHKMTLALTKFAETNAKPAPKPISKVPAPVDPINGGAKTATRLDDPDMSMDEFGPKFLEAMAKHRR